MPSCYLAFAFMTYFSPENYRLQLEVLVELNLLFVLNCVCYLYLEKMKVTAIK